MAERAAKKTAKKSAAPRSAATTGRSGMSQEHKAALARGRDQGRAVRLYLEAIESHRPRRGRKRTVESVERQLSETDAKLASATALDRVLLVQRQLDLREELASLRAASGVDMEALEERFVEVARDYSAAKGISYAAWRAAGVDAALLKRAGITRSGS